MSPETRKMAFRNREFVPDKGSVQTHGLVGWYAMGGAGGDTQEERDYSGLGKHGTREANTSNPPTPVIVNNPAYGGVRSLDFNGTTDASGGRIDVGTDWDFGLPFTICTWVYVIAARTTTSNVYNGNNFMFRGGAGGDPPYNTQFTLVDISGDGEVDARLGWFSESGGSNNLGSSDATAGKMFPDGEWGHAAITYDGTSIRFYRNGVSIRAALAISTPTGGTETVSLGGRPATGFGESVDGMLTDFRIYNCACDAYIKQIAYEPWRAVRPLGHRRVFLPTAATGSSVQLERKFNRGVMRGVLRGGA